MVILDAETLKDMQANCKRAREIHDELANLARDQCRLAQVEDDESLASEAIKSSVYAGTNLDQALIGLSIHRKA